MKEEQQLNFPFVSYYKGTTVHIVGYFKDYDNISLCEGNAYVHDGYVWKYVKKLPKLPAKYPLISIDSDGNIITKDSIFNEKIPISDIMNDRLNIICNHTKEGADFSKDVSVAPVASSNAVYVPVIDEEKDDFFKRIIKTVFLMKKVPTTKYRKKLSVTYMFSNIFQGLNSETKMSVTVWQTWIELLGLDCVIIVKDNGTDGEDAIDKYVVYKSRNDTVDIIEKDNVHDYLKDVL